MEEQLVHPLRGDGHGPLLFLQMLLWRLLGSGGLPDELLYRVRVQRVEHLIEEIAVRIPEIVFAALEFGQVITELGEPINHLRVDVLYSKLRPVRHVTGGDILLQQGLLPVGEDVLDMLQPAVLEGRHQVSNCM